MTQQQRLLCLFFFFLFFLVADAKELLWGGKIDDTGAYQRFGGITLICPVDRDAKAAWAKVYDAIAKDPLLVQYYAPLPASSYHVTIDPLFTEREARKSPAEFRAVLRSLSEGFEALHQATVDTPLAPRARLDSVHASRMILGASLTLDRPEDARGAVDLRNIIEKSIGLPHTHAIKHHMTFAYRFREPENSGVWRMLEQAARRVEDQIRATLVDENGRIALEPAALMEFESMTEFVPTDPMRWQKEEL